MLNKDAIADMLNSGKSMSKIAKELGVSVGTISTFCSKHNLKSQYAPTPSRNLPMAEIYDLYVNHKIGLHTLHKRYKVPISTLKKGLRRVYPGVEFKTWVEQTDVTRHPILNNRQALLDLLKEKSARQIAKQLKSRTGTVTKALRRLGIGRSPHYYISDEIPIDLLHKLYVEEELTPRAISRITDVSVGCVRRQLRKSGFPALPSGGPPRGSRYWQLNDAVWLRDQYETKKCSMADLSREVGCMLGTISYFLKKHNIQTRTRSQSLQAASAHMHGHRRIYKGMIIDSSLEYDFLTGLNDTQTIERNCELDSCGSTCYIDFKIDDQLYEIKPPNVITAAGQDRRRLIKQMLVCSNNNLQLNIWTGKLVNIDINDDDRYYCQNWKLIFKSPDEAVDWLLAYKFHPIKWSMARLLDCVKYANRVRPGQELCANFGNCYATELIKHCSPHYWYSTHKDYNPIAEAWEIGNRSVLRKIVKQMWDKKKTVDIYGVVSSTHFGRLIKDFAPPSLFKPWIAKHLYSKYLPDGGTIVDPCMGWGGRLIGCTDANYKYIGYDLNQNVIDSHHVLYGLIKNKLHHKPEFHLADSTIADFTTADLVLTSPPYDSTELYHGIDSQHTISEPIIDNILKKCNCTVILNVAKWMESLCMRLAEKHGRKLIDRLEMKNTAWITRNATAEPILVFK